MTVATSLEITLEAQGALPYFRYDLMQPLMQGRVTYGEVDASTGDIIDAKAWAALESSPDVKRLLPDYQEQNRRLFKEHGIFTPVHIILMGGKLNRAQPGLARRVYDAFARSTEMAYQD